MTQQHASDIRDNGRTRELPAPGNHGRCAAPPTVLITSDRKRNEHKTKWGGAAFVCAAHSTRLLACAVDRRANTETHACANKYRVTMAACLKYDKDREI